MKFELEYESEEVSFFFFILFDTTAKEEDARREERTPRKPSRAINFSFNL